MNTDAKYLNTILANQCQQYITGIKNQEQVRLISGMHGCNMQFI